MAGYGNPRRVNSVTVIMALLFAAGGYWCWRFFPVYFDAWGVDHILKEAASQTYQTQHLQEAQRMEQLKSIVEKARLQIIKQVGIHDPELTVDLNVDGDQALLVADYHVIVTHPWINKVTRMHFHRAQTANIKFVKWD